MVSGAVASQQVVVAQKSLPARQHRLVVALRGMASYGQSPVKLEATCELAEAEFEIAAALLVKLLAGSTHQLTSLEAMIAATPFRDLLMAKQHRSWQLD